MVAKLRYKMGLKFLRFHNGSRAASTEINSNKIPIVSQESCTGQLELMKEIMTGIMNTIPLQRGSRSQT